MDTSKALKASVNILRSAGFRNLGEIEAAPVLHAGDTADIIAEGSTAGTPWRVWRSRMGPEDGETHRVEVETLDVQASRWETLAKLYPYRERDG